jgi:hypothetical protein
MNKRTIYKRRRYEVHLDRISMRASLSNAVASTTPTGSSAVCCITAAWLVDGREGGQLELPPGIGSIEAGSARSEPEGLGRRADGGLDDFRGKGVVEEFDVIFAGLAVIVGIPKLRRIGEHHRRNVDLPERRMVGPA